MIFKSLHVLDQARAQYLVAAGCLAKATDAPAQMERIEHCRLLGCLQIGVMYLAFERMVDILTYRDGQDAEDAGGY